MSLTHVLKALKPPDKHRASEAKPDEPATLPQHTDYNTNSEKERLLGTKQKALALMTEVSEEHEAIILLYVILFPTCLRDARVRLKLMPTYTHQPL